MGGGVFCPISGMVYSRCGKYSLFTKRLHFIVHFPWHNQSFKNCQNRRLKPRKFSFLPLNQISGDLEKKIIRPKFQGGRGEPGKENPDLPPNWVEESSLYVEDSHQLTGAWEKGFGQKSNFKLHFEAPLYRKLINIFKSCQDRRLKPKIFCSSYSISPLYQISGDLENKNFRPKFEKTASWMYSSKTNLCRKLVGWRPVVRGTQSLVEPAWWSP